MASCTAALIFRRTTRGGVAPFRLLPTRFTSSLPDVRGHLSHGYQTDTKKISAVSISFETMPYRLNETTGYIDYDQLEKNAMLSRPKLIVAGASVYARLYDYARIRKVCDKQKAIMLADMTHISGLVVAGVIPSPFEYADVVTTTTHKSLRGPCGAMIFFRKGLKEVDKKGQEVLYETRSTKLFFQDFRVARTITLLWATTPEYKAYQEQVLKNCSRFAESLMSKCYVLVSGGTENHLVLVNLKCKPEPQSSSSVIYLQPVLEQFIDKVVMFRTLMDCTMAIQEDLELSASFSAEIDNMLDIGKISSILDRGSVLDLVAKLHSNVGKYLGHRAPIGDDALLGDFLSTNNGKIFYLDRR